MGNIEKIQSEYRCVKCGEITGHILGAAYLIDDALCSKCLKEREEANSHEAKANLND